MAVEIVEGEGSFEGKCGASHCNQWGHVAQLFSAMRDGDAALSKLLWDFLLQFYFISISDVTILLEIISFHRFTVVICNIKLPLFTHADSRRIVHRVIRLLHYNCFTAPWTSSRTTRVSRYQKGKTSLDLLEQETVSGSSISWAICKSAHRCRQITMPASHHSVFYKPDALPADQPTASKH